MSRSQLSDLVVPAAFEDNLRQRLSEVLSLREKVAQAELEAMRRSNVTEEGPTSQPASA